MFVKIFQSIKNNKQFQNFSIYGIGQLFNLITPLLIAPYIIKLCGEEGFGKAVIGLSFAFILTVLVDFASGINGVKEISVNRNQPEIVQSIATTLFSIKLISLFIVLLISSILIFNISFLYQEKELFFLSLIILVSQALNPTWFLQGIENVKWITLLNIVSKCIYLVGIFFTIKKESDYIYVNLWWGLGMIVSNFLVFIWIIKKYQFSFLMVNKDEVFKHIRNDFSMFSSQIFVSLQLYAPVVLISYFGSNLMAGQYRIVEQIIVVFKTYIFLFFNYVKIDLISSFISYS